MEATLATTVQQAWRRGDKEERREDEGKKKDEEGEQNKDEDDKAEDEANKEMRDEAASHAGENQVT